MNKRNLLLFGLLMALLLLLWLIMSEKEKTEIKPVNQVSLQKADEVNKQSTEVPEVIAAPKKVAEVDDETRLTKTEKRIDDELSYLEVYYAYEWVELCRDYYVKKSDAERKAVSFDYMFEYHNESKRRSNNLGFGSYQQNPEQNEVMRNYISRCEDIAKNEAFQLPEIDLVSYSVLQMALGELLFSTKAESQKEKQIKEVFLKTLEVDEAMHTLWDLRSGLSTLSQAEELQIMEQIAALMKEVTTSVEGSEIVELDGNHPAFKEILKLQQKLNDNKVVDPKETEQARSEGVQNSVSV